MHVGKRRCVRGCVWWQDEDRHMVCDAVSNLLQSLKQDPTGDEAQSFFTVMVMYLTTLHTSLFESDDTACVCLCSNLICDLEYKLCPHIRL